MRQVVHLLTKRSYIQFFNMLAFVFTLVKIAKLCYIQKIITQEEIQNLDRFIPNLYQSVKVVIWKFAYFQILELWTICPHFDSLENELYMSKKY